MADPIRYRVDLRDRAQHLVQITLTVPADIAPGARLVLPVWTPGSYLVRDYARHVQAISATDATGGEVAVTMDTRTSWLLPAGVTGPVDVHYELYANELTVRTNHVDDHHALLIPAATFVTVEAGADRPHEVTVVPTDGHQTHALLPAATAPDTYLADHRDHLIDSGFEVGALPSVDYEVAGVPHRFVWAGHGGHPDLDRVAKDARAIGEAAVDLFAGTLPVTAYTWLCVGWDEGGGGLEHRDGAIVQVPVRAFQDDDLYARFQSLLAHEYLHLWNVKRLVPAALMRPDPERPTHSASLWVAEGWTSYYDELLCARAGCWTLRRYLDALRDAVQQLDDTPGAKRQPLRQASFEAWTKHYVRDENTINAATSYYVHGGLVAWELDLRLRAADPSGDGIDHVLRLLWERHAHSDQGYTEDDVLAAFATVGGDDLARLAERRVVTAGTPELGDGVIAAVGLRWQVDPSPTPPYLGVTISEDDEGVTFTSVLRDRPAWRAGITGGDRLIAIDGQIVDRGHLAAVLRAYEQGDDVAVTVRRGPRLLTLPVTLDPPRPPRKLVTRDDATAAQQAAFTRWTGRPPEDA